MMPSETPPIEARFLPSGDTALVVEFGDRMDRHLSALVLNLRRRLRDAALEGVVEAVPTFRSLMVHYDPLLTSARQLETALAPLTVDLEAAPQGGHHWVFPTCYEGDLAPDLDDVANATGLSTDEVIRRHAAIAHVVYMIGFLPGLPYMGELPPELVLPRRTSPRILVPAGSVAIATNQSCVYPLDSPGGWHLIGRTAVPLYDLRRTYPVLLSPGDIVRFEPVERAVYEDMLEAARDGVFDVDTLREAA